MPVLRVATFFVAFLVGFAVVETSCVALAQETDPQSSLRQTDAAPPDLPPVSCHVTLPQKDSSIPSPGIVPTSVGIPEHGLVAAYGTEELSTMLPTDGVWRGVPPRKKGDYAYSSKLPWRGVFSYRDGPLTASGRRLDGPAPSFTAVEEISGRRAFMGFISVPTFGCWQIAAHYKDQELSFVVWVTQRPDEEPPSSTIGSFEPPRTVSRVHVNSEVEAKNLIYQVTPEFTRATRVGNVSGTVVLRAVIRIDGRPRDFEYVSGPPILAPAAIDAVTWWRYRITDLNMEIDTTIPVPFASAAN